MWRRVHCVPFHQSFSGPNRDNTLKDQLRREWPGILAWAVRGCLEWQERGLDPPLEVTAKTQEYRERMDPIGDFIDECIDDGDFTETEARVYQAYERWCKNNGERALPARTLSTKLLDRGWESYRRKDAHCWKGIVIKSEALGEW